MPNRLATEQSPYLLQHKDNPVDWYPWGEEAFTRARTADKPIFLSIGYSTCHWCHVMAHESFENPQIAEVLNEHFVSIKVDREERPDVDRVYMTFVQATTGSGGWPMSVWLTPSLEPFFGGTYYPPSSRWGRPGFVEVLTEIARIWREERDKVTASAQTIVGRLRGLGTPAAERQIPGPDVLDRTVREFAASFDAARGGFGTQPKFPRPSELLFLLREHYRTGSAHALEMVTKTLREMALGGMRDHIGGGFHRYSVDANWRVPHFEKMLYDQAQLVLTYVEAAQASGDPFFADIALDTLDYVRREMTDAGGGFYSAEDADSVPPETAGDPQPHKMEGAFYIWRDEEIGNVLGADADLFRARFGILADGNAPFDPQQEFVHKNLLYVARSIEEVAQDAGRPVEEVRASLDRSRHALRAVRARRPRPHLDDKILTAWNGLMIAAFARAGRMLDGAANCVADASRAAGFIRSRLWDPESRTLRRRYRQGEAAIDGYAEDYAYLIFGLLELFQADGDPSWLSWAIALQHRQDELFWDPRDGGWFSTTGQDPSILFRMKEEYDGAEPAASSVSIFNLLVLAHLTSDAQFSDRVEQALATFGSRGSTSGRAVPMLMAALATYHVGLPQIVVADADEGAAALHAVIRRHYLPTSILVPVHEEQLPALQPILPWIEPMTAVKTPTVYVCLDFACERPVTTAADLETALARLDRRGDARS